MYNKHCTSRTQSELSNLRQADNCHKNDCQNKSGSYCRITSQYYIMVRTIIGTNNSNGQA